MMINRKNYYKILKKRIPEIESSFPRRYGEFLIFYDLRNLAIKAHKKNDKDLLRRIYSYAYDCYHSNDQKLANVIGSMFYEDVIVSAAVRRQVYSYISKKFALDLQRLWQRVLSKREYIKLLKLYKFKKSDLVKHQENYIEEIKKKKLDIKYIKFNERRLRYIEKLNFQ